MKFLNDVYNFMIDNQMTEPADKIVIGLSGGADSVCLLLSLHALAERLKTSVGNLFAVHVNHMIRGAEADEDERFVRGLCERTGITYAGFRRDIPAYAKELGITVEEAGRRYRYECFREAAKRYGCNKIAVAHNKNDLAETVLFNMIRGSGLKGVGGIQPVRDNIIRPLLDMTRKQIEDYLTECNQDFREDSTNASLDYDRNRIRHVILPAMEEINAGAIRHICQIAEEAKASYSFIHDRALEQYEGYVENGDEKTVNLDINVLYKYSPVLQEHVIHEAIGDVAGEKKDITRRHVMSVVSLIYQDTGKYVELPYRLWARRSYDKLIISNRMTEQRGYCLDISGEGVYKIPDWGKLEISFSDNGPNTLISKKIYTKMADYGKINGSLCLRSPREGDYIIIDDSGNTKKLSRVFIDEKVDREKRAGWPVLACGQEIIWVPGLRYSAAYKIDEGTTRIIYMRCERKGE